MAVCPDETRIHSALAAASRFLTIDLDWRKQVPRDIKAGDSFSNPAWDLRSALIWFDVSKVGKPFTPNQRSQAVRRAIIAFSELRDALVGLDYPTQRMIADLHDRLGEQSKHGLLEFHSRLNYDDFTQRYWRECRAWIEGLRLLLSEPFNTSDAPNAQTARDRLILVLREIFASNGQKRKTVNPATYELRFINSVLKAMGAKIVADPARRVRALAEKKARKASATKPVQK